jgi:hypothetical protein
MSYFVLLLFKDSIHNLPLRLLIFIFYFFQILVTHNHICGAGSVIRTLTKLLGPAWHTLPCTCTQVMGTRLQWPGNRLASVPDYECGSCGKTLVIICLLFFNTVTHIGASFRYTSRGNAVRYRIHKFAAVPLMPCNLSLRRRITPELLTRIPASFCAD